ncbi:hypothetical protein [Vibrio rotiferianus]|nr:hypothetical protein [Vibrio rotiferianus]
MRKNCHYILDRHNDWRQYLDMNNVTLSKHDIKAMEQRKRTRLVN